MKNKMKEIFNEAKKIKASIVGIEMVFVLLFAAIFVYGLTTGFIYSVWFGLVIVISCLLIAFLAWLIKLTTQYIENKKLEKVAKQEQYQQWLNRPRHAPKREKKR